MFSYRKEIDGLRALAVIPVILYHADIPLFNGGFVGVDIFFVISGYLITSIIIKKINSNTFSFIEFYERRARRILPVLFIVIIISIPFAYLWMFKKQLTDFSESIVAIIFFVSNILFFTEQNYFAPTSQDKPLLHTWSLAVEEQYYLFFPLILVFLFKYQRKNVFIFVLFFTLLSLIICEWGSRFHPNANFYLAPTRAWEILAGSLASIYLSKNKIYSSDLFSLIGLILILISIFFFNEETKHPSVITLIPVFGTILILLFCSNSTKIIKFIGNKYLVGIGLISYSLYLWHYPLFVLFKIRNSGMIETHHTVIIIFMSLLLSFLSWKYVESPIRKKIILKSKKNFFLSIIIIMALLIISGIILIDKKYHERKVPKFIEKIEKNNDYISDNFFLIAESYNNLRKKNEFFGPEDNNEINKILFDLKNNKKKFLIIGNSHSVDFYNVLFFSKKINSKLQLLRYPLNIRDINQNFYSNINYTNSDAVILCSKMNSQDIDNIEKIISKIILDNKKLFICNNIFMWMNRSNYTKLDKRIVNAIKNNLDKDKIIKEINKSYTHDFYNLKFFDEISKQESLKLEKKLKKLSKRYDFFILNRMDYVCPQKKCKILNDNYGKLFFDVGHHTLLGASYFASVLDSSEIFDELIQ